MYPYGHMTRIGTSCYIEPSGPTTIASINSGTDHSLSKAYHDTSDNISIVPGNLPQRIQLGSDTLGSDSKQDTTDKTDHTTGQEHTELSSICFDHSGLDRMEAPTSRMNVQERNLAKKYNDELAAHNWDNIISHCGSGVVTKSDLGFEKVQLVDMTPKNNDVIPSYSVPINDKNFNDSQRRLFHGPTDCNVQSAIDDGRVYCTSLGKGVATNYVSSVQPFSSQSQLVPNHQLCGPLEVPSYYMAMNHNAVSQHPHGLHWRSVFNEKVRDPTMTVHSGSNLDNPSCTTTHGSISDDNYLKPLGSPVCTLPGIVLHSNVAAPISKDKVPYNNEATEDPLNKMTCIAKPALLISDHNSQMNCVVSGNQLALYTSEVNAHTQNDHSSQTTLSTNIGDSGHENPKRKRRKCKHGDVESCKRCSCKKSKCLKLYCECFAAKVYCSEFCSCGGCLNNHSHEETVLSTRIQIECRNPLAFAPKVICTSGPAQDFGEDSNATPASSRHKRGCHCKKSYCLKKYCECFQSGVGCSMSCRCESCKNSFGIRKGAQLLASEEIVRLDQKKEARLKEEPHEASKHRAFGETCGVPSTENLFTTPSTEPRRSLPLPPSECSKPSLPPTRTSSQLCSPTKTDVVRSHFGSYTEMHLGDGPSAMQQQQEDSSCTASVKVMSPNKKRVSPLHTGTSLSPMGRSGRKLVLKSIPSFPSLTSDVNSELQ
ncbi:hypothetical protein ABZP36_006077 [Zizania latifolia]